MRWFGLRRMRQWRSAKTFDERESLIVALAKKSTTGRPGKFWIPKRGVCRDSKLPAGKNGTTHFRLEDELRHQLRAARIVLLIGS